MSFGESEFSGEQQYDNLNYLFGHVYVTFVAAAGDSAGQGGADWPAVSPNVVGVGGTTLTLNASGGYGSETAWTPTNANGYSGTGGGASALQPMPSFQSAALGNTKGAMRDTPDVPAVGDLNTGLAVYDSTADQGTAGWSQVGGTSAGTPIWAGIVAAADQARGQNGLTSIGTAQFQALLYSASESGGRTTALYSSLFHDVTTGR